MLRSDLWIKFFILLAIFSASGCGASLDDPQADHSFGTLSKRVSVHHLEAVAHAFPGQASPNPKSV
jgi:hypothetical protein